MNQINLLPDSRLSIFGFYGLQKILFFSAVYFSIGGVGVWGGFSVGQRWQKVPVVVATEIVDIQPSFLDVTSPSVVLEPSIQQFQRAEKEITVISQTPIKLIYKTKLEEVEELFESEQIRSFLGTSVWGNQVMVVVNNGVFDAAISSWAGEIDRQSEIQIEGRNYLGEDRRLDQANLKQIIRDELFGRREGREPRSEFDITSLVQETVGSDGTLAEKYLEVDLSQQKLYQWENGEVVGVRIISTGKYGPTPIGVHKIMNKAINAWSPPAQVWTPFWMAYGYNPNLGAYLGFHELPYWDGPDGTRIRRPFDTLGEPVTGGCIQLNIGAAEEVFNWAEVGMPVLIHE